jgi:hypothetical protein
MKNLLICLLVSCSSDIAIITSGKHPVDTGETIITDTANASEPSIEDTADTNENHMTDLTIGFAEVSLTQIACPPCMGVLNEFDISASLKLHQPTSGGYSNQLTSIGTCATQEFISHISSTPLNVAGAAFFNSIQLYPTNPGEWSASSLQEYQIPRRESINIVTDVAMIANAFETLEGFDDIQPWELRYVDPSYAFAAVVSKQGTTFTWSPVITGAQFEVMVVVYSQDGSQMLGLVTCMEDDVGYMTVPGSYFQAYPNWALAAVYMTRHRLDRQPAYELNGWLESHQKWTVLGTAHIE